MGAFSNQNEILVDVAMGRKPADTVIHNGRWVCVQSGEILDGQDIAIVDGRIAYVGADASHTFGSQTQVIEAESRYMTPGLLDAHMHVESGMLTVSQFVRAVLPHGTTGMFIDPHEIANVFGLRGVRLIVDEAANQPIHVWVQVPSCVPSAPGFETPGATLSPEDVAQALAWPGIIGLGEVMNFPGVYNNDPKMVAEISATRQARKVIGGHYASPELGREFHGYAAGGPQDDHEGTRLVDAVARVRQGMKVMLRLGSAWHDVEAQIRAVTELGLDSRNFLLCTDDSHSGTLFYDGHVNRAVQAAITYGCKPITAIQMATINTAEYFGVSDQVGLIAPGRSADILLVKDLKSFHPDLVLSRGIVVAQEGRVLVSPPTFTYPDWSRKSTQLASPLRAEVFQLSAPVDGQVTAHVIGVIENQAPTRHLRLKLPVVNGVVNAHMGMDVAKIALVERHQGSGRIQIGLVQGFGFDVPCAVATTVAHDCHQMVIVGTDDQDMALAGNRLAEIGGGQVFIRDGEELGLVHLPIAGLLSDQPVEVVAEQAASVLTAFQACGCKLNNPNMQLSLLALVVIPELRISDLGLVDVNNLSFISLFEEIAT